ncbi:MAG: hypothetical protein Ct9H300mP1_14240 [Planctomycetaceae bacterium]|nr:MAG: hypothetical protein Ct9H300mP1_14240 [Planctomycetaceae bacterium]
MGIEKLLAVIGGSLGECRCSNGLPGFPTHRLGHRSRFRSQVDRPGHSLSTRSDDVRFLVDPNFNDGNYYGTGEVPRFGLGLARMVAHLTYLSEASIEMKFGRRLQDGDRFAYDLARETEFQVESYLHSQRGSGSSNGSMPTATST